MTRILGSELFSATELYPFTLIILDKREMSNIRFGVTTQALALRGFVTPGLALKLSNLWMKNINWPPKTAGLQTRLEQAE